MLTPAVTLLLVVVLGVGQAVLAQVACVDGARAGARAAARGDDVTSVRRLASSVAGGAPPENGGGVAVRVARSPGRVVVVVSKRLRLLGLAAPVRASARASAQVESGSATAFVIGICCAALTLVLVAAGLGSAVVARHRAASVADLAALAAADTLSGRAAGSPCGAALRVVQANGGAKHDTVVTGCYALGAEAEVQVEVRPAGWVASLGVATARARAGPPAPV